MRFVLALVAAVGVFVMVGMLVAPHQPEMRACTSIMPVRSWTD